MAKNNDFMKLKILTNSKNNNFEIEKINLNKNIEIKKSGLLFGDYMIYVNDLMVPVTIIRLKNYKDFYDTFLDRKIDVNKNNEFLKKIKRAAQSKVEIILIVEDELFFKKLFTDNKLKNRVIELESLYNLRIVSISDTISTEYIYLTLYYRAIEFYKKVYKKAPVIQ